MRFFNTAGPVDPVDHYCLDPLSRLDLADVLRLIEQKKYFVLHAPRQTGKTSCLLALMAHLNRGEVYRAVYANLEAAQGAREDGGGAMRAILCEVAERARIYLGDEVPATLVAKAFEDHGPFGALKGFLGRWAEQSPRPLVLLIDEIDSLIGDTLISVLRQLRSGYDRRPASFPQSVVLCGVRDVRDYRIHSSQEKAIITGGSAFNVKAKSLRVGDLHEAEVRALLGQHTAETGQPFEPATLEAVWQLTAGQPWLVNALAYEICFDMPEGRDRRRPLTAEMVVQAKENLILRRVTHLDQLADKLQEERVRRVIGPLLAGEAFEEGFRPDDVQYVVDLGLIRRDAAGSIGVANPIYGEVIPRELAWGTQLGIAQETSWYVRPDGTLDLGKLLGAFQEFFREHFEHWVERFEYKEAGPQLLLQAFLQRIVNSGGRIEREYGLGRLRTDLLVLWPHTGGTQKAVIELKVAHKGLEAVLRKGLDQTWEYADRCAAGEAHLVVFDRTPGKPWEEKLFERTEEHRGRTIRVWGM